MLLPLAGAVGAETYLAVLFEVADLYALLGYRNGNKRNLKQAALRFKRISQELPTSAPGRLRLRSLIALGDTHALIGLNRNSIRHARIGLKIMQMALADVAIAVAMPKRANALIRLGPAQCDAGLMAPGGSEFDDAVRTYEAAMALFRDAREPFTEAHTW